MKTFSFFRLVGRHVCAAPKERIGSPLAGEVVREGRSSGTD
jgi:hypothetical protein